jgi:signal transduction histidine kinase/CheY-like chemotaxis protein
MNLSDVSNDPVRLPDWSRYFGIIKPRFFLLSFVLFLTSAIWLSVRIMKLEIHSATNRLIGHSAGASRNLETQFDSMRDDFRVLASTGAFDVYATESLRSSHDYAMVKRFFARYQEIIAKIEVEIKTGGIVRMELAPGNYLRTSHIDSPKPTGEQSPPSTVVHQNDYLIVEEMVPPGESQVVTRIRLVIDHNRFFADRLAGYLMGQTDLWIWSIEKNAKPTLIRNPMKMSDGTFDADKEAIRRIQTTLDRGLEGVNEHDIMVPARRSVVSVFTPLLLGDEQMGLVFSTDREVHLGSLHRMSTFLGLIFLGSLVLLGSWFAISYTRVRESEREQAAARQRAETADRAKSEFVAAMSHEIRTPLNGVLGYADLLMSSGLSTEQRDYLEVIRNSGDHLLSILNDILDFSKITTGNMTMRRQEYSPVECADDVIDMMTTAAEDQGLELHLEVRGEIPEQVMGDPGRLRQVLYNLTGNGIKFTGEGFVRVAMSAQDQGDVWRLDFSVSDTGIGIPMEKRKRLFAPFSQLDSSNARAYEGAGLGLAICSRLVEKMDGEIDFESKPGVGSDFRFWIKAGKVDGYGQNHADRPLEGKTVLIIDPAAQSLETLSGRIRRLGAHVLAASGEGDAASMLGQGHTVDLVMIDWQGRDETGRDIATLLEKSQGQSVPMVALSNQRVKAVPPESRFRERMTKPVRLASLERRLSKLMNSLTGNPWHDSADSLQILIAEDNIINSELMVALLEQRGAATTVASNGLEALSKLEQQDYDLVFMDVEMPGLDGIEVTKRIRDKETGVAAGRTRIVGLSAHAFQEDRKLAIQAGMDDYLTKPVNITDLDRVLTEGMDYKRARQR